MAQLEVDVVAADGKVWSGAARLVSAPAADGDIGILAGHTPLLSVLRPGAVRVVPASGGAPLSWHVDGGFLSVDSDQVTVVVDSVSSEAGVPAAGR
ncbi:F0F1 ATP synthase subunit epsilon [Cellulomonas wangsupingiae]|uniref:ATP synthase epsilon chain n=1 Tax=Cellulomonas wangsupingiae TaxID=2968085 RepID=A0ABY5K9U6_9CELL|nr:F0F1 ATP synthase subunit epsilon [Cellulomonas wangsupingiae]MCC2334519.1 F0F1 ATP synthase subunit epsilon [Cellulomonas wangsupingiae]MCM0640110.1 F0F1 ATP synthase subunit epsilon [Cellulomonas wangsupingiae]UUI66176.1 F0F1 ATP synthase subunit epsilon [Cellulomonas wangsupingiae]